MALSIRLSIFFILLPLLFMGCLQTENSSSQDDELYSVLPEASGPFAEVQQILASECSDCHNFHTLSEETLVSSGYLMAGDPENSSLFYRLSNSSGSNGPKNMPPSGALIENDLLIIFDWIESL